MRLSFLNRTVILSAEQQAEVNGLCESVSALLQRAGYSTSAFPEQRRDYGRDVFKRLEWLKIYHEVVSAHLNEGGSPKDHKGLLWRFLGRMGYTPTSDIFDLIGDEDYIEVYDNEGYQVYRNLAYFGLVSLSVEDLLNMNWKRDYKRDRNIALHLLGVSIRFATGQFHKTFSCAGVPVHYVQEMLGKRYLCELGLKYLSPVKRNGKCVALIATSRARRVDPAV